MGSNDQADCELAWVSSKGNARLFHHTWNGMIKASERNEKRVHPTQKPVQLMKWCLGFFPDASLILDPYMGAGSTLLAAKDLGRKAIGIEIEERYCEIAAKRMSQSVMELR
jgi:site-specific DNA-methyltransferase (adenine-specific)